jgi:hypothetical protein
MVTASPFLSFAERHDLDYAERAVSGGAGGFQLGGGEAGELVGGSLPGGLDGIAGPLARADPDDPRGQGGRGRSPRREHFGLLVTRIPASISLLPYLTCRDTEVRGFADRLIGPGGLIPLVDHVEFESIELNRRYRIGIFRGTDEGKLRELFAPTFIDWMAHTSPEGLYFELFGGTLSVTLAGEIVDEAGIERLCSLAGHVVERIRSESLEGVAPGDMPPLKMAPEQAEAERERERKLAAAQFRAPPQDYATALDGVEPLVQEAGRGFMRRIFKSINRAEAADLAMEALMRGYADQHGLERKRPGDLLARAIASPLPIAPQFPMRGALPGLEVAGDLFAVRLGDAAAGPRYGPGAAFEVPDGGAGYVLVTPGRPDPNVAMIGGFPVSVAEGARRESQASRRARDAALTVQAPLAPHYSATVSGPEAGGPLAAAAVEWLLAPERAGQAALLVDPPTVTAVAPDVAATEWSWAALDAFCASLAGLADSFR